MKYSGDRISLILGRNGMSPLFIVECNENIRYINYVSYMI